MHQFNKLLIALDTRLEGHPLAELGPAVARSNASAVTVVDAVPEVSWLARIVGSELDKLRSEARAGVEAKVNELASLFTSQGVASEAKLLDGTAWLAITNEAKGGDYDLVMASEREGEDQANGFLGRTARRLLRNCPLPLWLVPAGASPEVRHVLACVDTGSENSVDSELNDRVYRLAASIAEQQGARLSLLHAWDMEDELVLRARLRPPAVESFLKKARDYRAHLLDRFLQQYNASLDDDHIHLCKGAPEDVVSEFCSKHTVDLVVMGTVARSGLAGVVLGNTAERILEKITSPVLAVKPFHLETASS
jgi:nucleotide-binding universal stress UspA family protein